MSDEEAIRRQLARFIQLRDDKRFGEWAALFEPAGVFTYGTKVLVGREAIRADVEELLRHDRGKHLCTNSVIDVAGERAAVVSDVVKLRVVDDPDGPSRYEVQVMGRYHDELVRTGGEWLFARRAVVLYGEPAPPTTAGEAPPPAAGEVAGGA